MAFLMNTKNMIYAGLAFIILSLLALHYVQAKDLFILKNWGLSDSHINAVNAWKIQEGSSKVVVAVIDTGVDVTHPDLAGNIWHDPKNPDIYGWDFVTDKPNPIDTNSHGTHIAGIIGAKADYVNGVSGVAHNVSIMSIKFYSESSSGSVNLRNTIKAIDYAVDHGAKIINYSGGGPEFAEDEYLALKRAEKEGVLVVCAAGNEHENVDLVANYYYPASYKLSNIITVSALDTANNITPYSNWGMRVDVAAPGEGIFSTLPGGKFGTKSGSSQATAFVSGEAALILSKNSALKPEQVKHIILDSVDIQPGLVGKTLTGGYVDAYQALLRIK